MAINTLVNKGFQQITDASSAVGLTVPAGAVLAVISAVAKDIRWRDDGTSPTASVGHVIAAGEYYEYRGDLGLIEFIEVEATAEINVSYYA